LRFAQSKGIPTFIHESNSFAGKSNIMLGKKATKIFTAAKGMEKFFPADRITVTGNPVRKNISEMNVSRSKAIKFFGLDENIPVVLSIGGSLGAKSINESIYKHIDSFHENNLQLIWQTGKPYAPHAKEIIEGRENIYASDFIYEMEYAYAAADIVVSRSGAMAIAELCVAKKPVVFVPYPFASEDHQTANAMNLVEQQAALMVKDYEAMEKLVPAVIELSKDWSTQKMLAENIAKLGITDADEKVAEAIVHYLKK
jgi:UDP-N-acetylglucosamine--N-acetylmuramyl-(pentapeptide) pyrophosphoryl-undecaprenol N-acetylglucosamine transferase